MGCWPVGAGSSRIARAASALSGRSVERARQDHVLGDKAELDVPVTAGLAQQVECLLFADLAKRHENADGHPDPAVRGKCRAQVAQLLVSKGQVSVSRATSARTRSEASAWPSD